MKRKLLIGLGGLTSLVTPIAALSCACSSKEESKFVNPPIDKTTEGKPIAPYSFRNERMNIENNSALIDMTSNDHPGVIEVSWFFSTFYEVFIHADNVVLDEFKEFIEWINGRAREYPFIKIAYKFYFRGNKNVVVHKLVITNDQKKLTLLTETFNTGEQLTKDLMENQLNKRSTDIEDFYNPNW